MSYRRTPWIRPGFQLALLCTGLALHPLTRPHAGLEGQSGPPPPGRWDVTDLTGSVRYISDGPAPPEGLCTVGDTTYQAVTRGSFLEIHAVNRPDPADVPEFDAVVADMGLLPTEVPAPDLSRTFVFHLEFENGYHTSEVLEDEGIAFRRAPDSGGLLSRLLSAFGEGYLGYWSDRDQKLVGYVILNVKEGEVGTSQFTVMATVDDAGDLTGSWWYGERDQMLDCTQSAIGDGSFTARRR